MINKTELSYWQLKVSALVFLLVLQPIYFFRHVVVSEYPNLYPIFSQVCKIAGCKIHYGRNAAYISLESLYFSPAAEQGDNVMQFRAMLKNKIGFVQELPSIEITIEDEDEYPILRKHIHPSDYRTASHAKRLEPYDEVPIEFYFRVNLPAEKEALTVYRARAYYFANNIDVW